MNKNHTPTLSQYIQQQAQLTFNELDYQLTATFQTMTTIEAEPDVNLYLPTGELLKPNTTISSITPVFRGRHNVPAKTQPFIIEAGSIIHLSGFRDRVTLVANTIIEIPDGTELVHNKIMRFFAGDFKGYIRDLPQAVHYILPSGVVLATENDTITYNHNVNLMLDPSVPMIMPYGTKFVCASDSTASVKNMLFTEKCFEMTDGICRDSYEATSDDDDVTTTLYDDLSYDLSDDTVSECYDVPCIDTVVYVC